MTSFLPLPTFFLRKWGINLGPDALKLFVMRSSCLQHKQCREGRSSRSNKRLISDMYFKARLPEKDVSPINQRNHPKAFVVQACRSSRPIILTSRNYFVDFSLETFQRFHGLVFQISTSAQNSSAALKSQQHQDGARGDDDSVSSEATPTPISLDIH